MFKKCLANRITRHNTDYKCYLCHDVMKESHFDVVKEHLLSEKHKNKLNRIDKENQRKELDQLDELTTGPERRRIVENLITFDKCSDFVCHICKCKISGVVNILIHIDGSPHKKNLINFMEQNKKDVEQKAKQVSCDKITTKKTAVEKVVSDQHSIPVLQSGSNGITYDEHNNHYCNICKIKIIATPNISQHTQGLLHQYLESKSKNSSSSSKSNHIVYDEKCNSYSCTLCKCKITSDPNVTQHIQGFMHQTILVSQKAMKTKTVESVNQRSIEQKILKSVQAQQGNKVDSTKQDKITQNKIILKQNNLKSHFTDIYYCNPCQVFIDDNTLLQCHIFLHLCQEFDSLRNLDLIQFKLKPNKKFNLHCLLCNHYICEESLIGCADRKLAEHLKTDNHLSRLSLFNYIKNDAIQAINDQVNNIKLENSKYQPKNYITVQSLCNACNVPVFLNNQKEHASGKNHNKNVSENAISNTANKTEFNTKVNVDNYACFMCGKSFYESSKLLKHLITPAHQWKIIALSMINKCPYMRFTKKKVHDVIVCTSCNICMYDNKTALEHMLGKKHKQELILPISNWKNKDSSNNALLAQVAKKFENLSVKPKDASSQFTNNSSSTGNKNVAVIKTKSLQKIKQAKQFEASVEELHELGFDMENILPLEPGAVNETLNNLVQLNFNDSQIKRLPSQAKVKTRRMPKVEDHKQIFTTKVLQYGKTFVKLCIDAGPENIYNCDDEKFSLLKLGVTLTFPYYSDRACIPCADRGEQFPDNVQSLFEHLKKQEHLKLVCGMLIDDEGFKNCPEQFSDLRLAKLYMHTSDSSIECRACDIRIEDKDDIIRQHAENPAHKERTRLWKEESDQLFNQYLTIYQDIWYYAEVFFCEVCKQKSEFEIDFAMHLIHPEHMKKVYELKHKGNNLTFDLCPSCITYWFGATGSYELHCQSDFHKRLVTNKDFMVNNVTVIACEYLDNIDTNIELLVSESDKVNLQKDNEKKLLKAIVETVKPIYPNAEAYMFGSRLSDLGFPDSDADVFLDCGNVYYESSTEKESQQYVSSVKSYFSNLQDTWFTYEDVLKTRIPIMKLRHIPTTLECDISFTNGLGVEKSRLIGLYNGAFPTCRKLILFMKKWLTLFRLSGRDCITTFAISWCVIFYLQIRGVLPTVDELIKSKNESKIVDGWECGYEEMITAESSDLTFKDHLKGFFTYFANFNYQNSVICPYLGKTIDKHTFAYTDELPAEMDVYKRRLKKNEVEIFRFDSPMCIQDPIDLSQNLTKAVKKQKLRCFRQYCMLSAAKC